MNEVSAFEYRLKDGKKKKWGYRFEIASVEGKRRWDSKRGFDTKADALQAGKEAQAVYERKGRLVKPSEMSYADFFLKWIAAIGVKETTKENYTKKARLYIVPRIGHLRIRSIRREDLRNLLIDLINEGFAYNTLNVIKGILVKSFEFAVEEHYLLESPAVGLKMPRVDRPEHKTRTAPHVFIKQEQIDKIFERFPEGHPSHIPLLLGYSCGLRIGETFGLTWDDIDLDAKTLTVNRQVQWHADETRTIENKKIKNGTAECGNGYWYFTNPKYGSVRTIAISDHVTEVLQKEKDRQERAKVYYQEYYNHYYVNDRFIINQDADGEEIFFVMVREAGDYISLRTLQWTSRVIHTQLDFPEFDYHSLRHTHASMLAEMGAPANYVSHRLGHKNVSTTLDVYYHLTDVMTEDGNKYLNSKF